MEENRKPKNSLREIRQVHSPAVTIRQFKQGSNQIILDLPAGMVDKNESPRKAAMRELREETGYRPKKMIKLGSGFIAPRNSITRYTLFLGLECYLSGPSIPEDSSEEIETNLMSLKRWKKIATNPRHPEMRSPYPLVATLWAESHLKHLRTTSS